MTREESRGTTFDAMARVGRIARAHGIAGQVIVDPDTDFPEERFQAGAELFMQDGGVARPVRVATVRFHRGRPILGLEGIRTRDEAEALAGAELRVPMDRLAPLPAETFYRHDLVGCRVETTSGRAVGVVKEVEGSLGGSRLVIAGERGEILVPLAAGICTAIDVGAKRIVIDPPEGLLDLNG